jgi:hypothetical protein
MVSPVFGSMAKRPFTPVNIRCSPPLIRNKLSLAAVDYLDRYVLSLDPLPEFFARGRVECDHLAVAVGGHAACNQLFD